MHNRTVRFLQLVLPPRPRLLPCVLAIGLALACLASRADAQNTYTWNQSGAAAFTGSSNWTPTRSSPQPSDILVFDGAVTPAPAVTDIATQTIGRLRFIGGVSASFSTASNSRTLTLSGTGTPALEIAAGCSLVVNGVRIIQLVLASGATAVVAGDLGFGDAAHKLTGASAGAVVFTAGSSFTTLAAFKNNPFGSNGTPGTVVFQDGSTYLHHAGADPFGLQAPASKVVFETGSTFVVRNATGFDPDGRTYANLTIDNATTVSGSGQGNFQFQALLVKAGSSFSHSASSSATVTITGGLSSEGVGNIALGSGTGGIRFTGTGTQVVGGGGGSGGISLIGNVTVASGATLALSRTIGVASGSMTVNGALEIRDGGGVSVSSLAYGPGAALQFANASSPLTVTGSTNYWPLVNGPADVRVTGAATVTISSATSRTIAGVLDVSGPLAGADRLTVTGTLQRGVGGVVTGAPVYGSTATLVYGTGTMNAGAEWGAGASAGPGVPRHVTVGASASVTLPAADRYVPGNLTISGVLALNPALGNLLVGGDWTCAGTLVANDRTVVFNGTGNQIVTMPPGGSFDVLQVIKGGGELVLGSDVVVARVGFLEGGVVRTGAHAVVVGPAATLTRSAGFVLGRLRKTIPAGSSTRAFELGTGSTYVPVTLTFNGVTTSGTLDVTANPGDHPQLATSPIDPARSVNRWWSLAASGITLASYDATCTFATGDVDAGAAPLRVARYAGAAWSEPTLGTVTTTSAQGTGLTAFGELAVGQFRPHVITATAGPNGVIAPAGSVSVAHRGSQAFTITPDAHHSVAGVNVDGVPVGAVTGYTFTNVATDRTIAATFTVDRHTLVVTPGAGGSVTRNPDTPDYAWGSTVTLTAVPAVGYHFVGWGGAASGANASYALLMDGNKSVTAQFAINSYPLAVVVSGLGTVSRSPNQTSYDHGTVVQLNAYPDAGYAFSGWSGTHRERPRRHSSRWRVRRTSPRRSRWTRSRSRSRLRARAR